MKFKKNKHTLLQKYQLITVVKFNMQKLIKCAKENGADAVKLQTYTADTMTPNSNKPRFKLKSGL